MWRTMIKNLRERDDSELEQSFVRWLYLTVVGASVHFGAFPGFYADGGWREWFFPFGYAYWAAHLLHMALRPNEVLPRRLVAIVMDQFMVMFTLFCAGPGGAPLLFMSATISAGYGLRFGSRYAVMSATVSGLGLCVVGIANPAWQGNDLHWLIAMILLVSVVPMYTAHLGRRIEKQRAEDEGEMRRLAYLATHDALTGLANRALFTAQLQKAITSTKRTESALAIMFIDLDQFKAVNDRLGHDVGDDLLCRIARQLQNSVRPYDTVARLGGDEFVVLLDRLRDVADLEGIKTAMEIRLRDALTEAEASLGASASIGSSLCLPGEEISAEDLLKRADEAMYAVKRQRRSQRLQVVNLRNGQDIPSTHTATAKRA